MLNRNIIIPPRPEKTRMSVFVYEKENVLFVREDHPAIAWLEQDKWLDMAHINQTSQYSFGFVKVHPATFEYILTKYSKPKTPEK